MTDRKTAKDNASADSLPRRMTGLVSFGADVRRLLGPVLGKKGFIQADILSHWEDILGKELSRGVIPDSVSFSKSSDGGAVLRVKAFSGAYAVEFNACKEQILEKINSYFGYAAVADIRLTQGSFAPVMPTTPFFSSPSPQKQTEIKTLTAEITDENLRKATTELGLLLDDSKK